MKKLLIICLLFPLYAKAEQPKSCVVMTQELHQVKLNLDNGVNVKKGFLLTGGGLLCLATGIGIQCLVEPKLKDYEYPYNQWASLSYITFEASGVWMLYRGIHCFIPDKF